jgi:hypothetical protein
LFVSESFSRICVVLFIVVYGSCSTPLSA